MTTIRIDGYHIFVNKLNDRAKFFSTGVTVLKGYLWMSILVRDGKLVEINHKHSREPLIFDKLKYENTVKKEINKFLDTIKKQGLAPLSI
jgi:hypothetical protein